MSEKVLTFEEWDNASTLPIGFINWTTEQKWKYIWEQARVGMIPAENAVVIPDVSEWPKEATKLVLIARNGFNYIKDIAEYHRPKPVWIPKVGEAVFYDGHAHTHVATITGYYTRDSQYTILLANGGVVDRVAIRELKPFHESHIGKKWDEIPGGVE